MSESQSKRRRGPGGRLSPSCDPRTALTGKARANFGRLRRYQSAGWLILRFYMLFHAWRGVFSLGVADVGESGWPAPRALARNASRFMKRGI